ncbi:MAG: hypothetical protein MR411_03300 [Tenericutes bacterium]|nr:hypothetical protein [Mycoplasmatota bacterium]
MKLINKYTELRDEIYNDLVNKIEISKKDKKVLDTTIAFQITDYRGTNKEISEITGISKSSVQRYLNDKETIEKLFSKDLYNKIQESLKENIRQARSIGGINSTKNNIYLKDEKGKFIGIKQKRIELQ